MGRDEVDDASDLFSFGPMEKEKEGASGRAGKVSRV